MKIFVNGQAGDYRPGLTIEDLIACHRLSPESALVELNGTALHRRDWPGKILKENDRIEILQVAAGG